jgi:isoleucyl-tRNA synthetase
VRVTQLLAPWAPFISDYLWRQLTNSLGLVTSVHLSDWPKPGKIDDNLILEMKWAREIINEGLAQRATAGIKVRQPLADATIPKLPDHYKEVIAEELNVKTVKWGKELKLNTILTPELKREGLIREVVRNVQNARKQADLQVDDRINLALTTEDKELSKAIAEHAKIIAEETLAKNLNKTQPTQYSTTVKVEGNELTIFLEKAK